MYIDITTKITPKIIKDAQGNEMKALTGHLGTHFDVMNKEFPLEYLKKTAVIFDVRSVRERDISTKDIDLDQIQEQMFVIFHTGFIEDEGYGTEKYFKEHPQLSDELIDVLLKKKVSMIGIDFAGVRRGKEHTPKDQYCADRGVFIIENLCNLGEALRNEAQVKMTAYTFPVNYAEMTGLPCRVILEV